MEIDTPLALRPDRVNTLLDSVFLRTIGPARYPGTHLVEIQPPLPEVLLMPKERMRLSRAHFEHASV